MLVNKKALIKASLILSSACFFSCGTEQADKELTGEGNKSDTTLNVDKLAEVQKIFYTIPSPMEMASLLKKTGSSYNASILNDIHNVSKYTSVRNQALNLGIYGADLSYTSIFNQNQESIIYLSCAKQLADNMGVTNAFNKQTMERIEGNVENRDSLLDIISESFYILDAYLKENNRDNISAMVIAGGWVEGLYIATKLLNEKENDADLIKRIAEQKISLDNLISLISQYPDDPALKDVLADLQSVKTIYEKVQINSESGTVTKDKSGTTIIGGKSSINMDQSVLKEIISTISAIRNKYIG
jgi:hypothetical protein